MSEILIVNRHGVFHTVPEALLDLVARQGGRRATEAEQAAYEVGQTKIGGSAPVVAAPAETAAPWPDYDSLNAEQIAARLKTMPQAVVMAALEYEAAHKKRKTVLDIGADMAIFNALVKPDMDKAPGGEDK